jgi:YidC/Oxa1 family membrane protein insertase
MLWLLTAIYRVVRNYGIAIIVLVIIVKLILHPISKRGQLSMMKMQKSMAQVKPKLDLLQQQYRNDKQKLQEETLKLYREEGINPAGNLAGCLPLFLQMPIWVALWSTLNTNADMRHQPFFWWIRDLASPDALIPLSPDWHFTVPVIGKALMGGPITALNVLPILMIVTMYLQQKFTQKLTRPDGPAPAPKLDAEGRPLPDPMAQQQKMMPYMMAFMGLLFYNFPSGLNLYVFSNSLLGMLEQYQIRKHLKKLESRGELPGGGSGDGRGGGSSDGSAGGAPPKPSIWQKLEKKAEEARLAKASREELPRKKRRKQSRF